MEEPQLNGEQTSKGESKPPSKRRESFGEVEIDGENEEVNDMNGCREEIEKADIKTSPVTNHKVPPHLTKPIIRSLSGTQFKYSPAYTNNGTSSPTSSAPNTMRESTRNRNQGSPPPPLSARAHPLATSSSNSPLETVPRAWSSQQVISKDFGSTQQLSQLSQSLHANRIRNSTLVMFHPSKPQARPNTMQPHSQSSPSLPHRNGLSTSKSSNNLSSVSKKHASNPSKSSASPTSSSSSSSSSSATFKNHKFEVLFVLLAKKGSSDGFAVSGKVSGKKTGADIKQFLLKEAKPLIKDLVNASLLKKKKSKALLKSIDHFSLIIRGTSYHIQNDSLPLHRIGVIQMFAQAHIQPTLEMILRDVSEEEEDKERESRLKKRLNEDVYINNDIKKLLSADLLRAALTANSEALAFRKQMTKLRTELKIGDDIEKTYFPRYMDTEPLPLVTPNSILFTCHFITDDQMRSQLSCKPTDTADCLIEKAFKKICMAYKDMQQKTSKEFILKVTGFKEFLYGDTHIISYDYIRKCLSKELPISLTLFHKETLLKSLREEEVVSETKGSSLVDEVLLLKDIEDEDSIEISAFDSPFRIRINGAENLPKNEQEGEDSLIFVCAALYHSGVPIGEPAYSSLLIENPAPQWSQWLYFSNIKISDLPRGARLCFTIYRRMIPNSDPSSAWQKGKDAKDIPVACVSLSLFDHRGYLRDSVMPAMKMWKKCRADPTGTISENITDSSPPFLSIEFESSLKPIRARSIPPPIDLQEFGAKASEFSATENAVKIVKLDGILAQDPLTELTSEYKKLIYEGRYYCAQKSGALAKFLESVVWHDPIQANEAYRLLPVWQKPSPLQALELLDAKYGDPIVRTYAVKLVEEGFTDGETYDFLLQLTQVLKHELHHDSGLVRFLLKKAWQNTKIAHSFYWHLKAEQHIPEIAERYTLILESFLRGCGKHRTELAKQADLVKKLVVVAEKIKKIPQNERKESMLADLRKLKLPPRFQLPLDQRMEAKGLIVDKCKYMDSKKLPLWLVFENAEPLGKPITVIFKCGDDLRQDVLTLQMIRIMDKLWKRAGLDLRLNAYGACVTGNMEGMIEVVLNADTTANINKAAGILEFASNTEKKS
eukprot:TRINITY_DN2950_c0_g1_i3.p1 TRINITY_DN2950_c0_g1~~TRINITY_DN2950_c0_g1_i3.p1  ORF type:complete len:1114 (+),score=230.47 TRINITY_DN2950_c0_g1_i3:111-3452(+)